MALNFKKIREKAQNAWPRLGKKTQQREPDLREDVFRENVETEPKDYRLSFRFSSILDHVKKNWSDLKSLKNKL
jgi:hypothetical protein